MKVIFLDIDGVLNCRTSKSYCHDDEFGIITGIDSDKVRLLAKIVNETNAKIVLSSDWKEGWEKHYITHKPSHAKYLDNHLKKKGNLTISDKTPTINRGFDRGAEILQYLKTHQDIDNYVILDDTSFDDFSQKEIEEHLVLTSREVGITNENVNDAIKILSETKSRSK